MGGPKFSLYFPSPATIFFPSFSWGSSRGILVVFEAPGPWNVHVWALGLSCETLETPFGLKGWLHHQNSKKEKIVAGEGKGAKFWAVRRRGGPGEHPKLGPTHDNTHNHTTHTTTTQNHNTQHTTHKTTTQQHTTTHKHKQSDDSAIGMKVVLDESGFGMKAVR